jgi:hypothetical protein
MQQPKESRRRYTVNYNPELYFSMNYTFSHRSYERSCVRYYLAEGLDIYGYNMGEEKMNYDTRNRHFTIILNKIKK